MRTNEPSTELLKEIATARAAAAAADKLEPRASTARYDPGTRAIEILLVTGRTVPVRADLIQGLQGASDHDLADIEVTPSGSSLHWEALDIDIGVPALIGGTYGTRAWMAQLGKTGGLARTQAKAAAARENGRKGGRPRTAPARTTQPPKTAGPVTARAQAAPGPTTAARPRQEPAEDREVRLPRPLWERLARQARRDRVSIDAYMTGLLAELSEAPAGRPSRSGKS